MDFNEYFSEKKIIQETFLSFLDNSIEEEEDYRFQNLIKIILDKKITEDKLEFKILLNLILKVTNNHYRLSNFYNKIKRIMHHFKNDIKLNFSNRELFNIFMVQRTLILICIEEEIIVIDQDIADYIKESASIQYQCFLYPEIKQYLDDETSRKIQEKICDIQDFENKRKKGTNDSYICTLIQNDLIDEFVIHVNKNNINLSSNVNKSFFESNKLLRNYITNLINYASFYGSIQIFNYLRLNNVEMTDRTYLYAIHGNNPEIIHILEEYKIKCDYKECIKESIKCHHNEMASYFLELSNDQFNHYISRKSLLNYNFSFVFKPANKNIEFFLLCRYGYYNLVNDILSENLVNVNYQATFEKRFWEYTLTPLTAAIGKKNVDIVKLLLSNKRTNVNLFAGIFKNKYFFSNYVSLLLY
ncbi:hypothetical protein M9Y10_005618 [Tritrichomonas musculus]|uniref:DUF3447 domain-containing protein n=1 Tax=Tritrichomonas musculus TaxID=1915356 RepID=A0ABR2JE91_9EUKA